MHKNDVRCRAHRPLYMYLHKKNFGAGRIVLDTCIAAFIILYEGGRPLHSAFNLGVPKTKAHATRFSSLRWDAHVYTIGLHKKALPLSGVGAAIMSGPFANLHRKCALIAIIKHGFSAPCLWLTSLPTLWHKCCVRASKHKVRVAPHKVLYSEELYAIQKQ